MAGRGGNTRGRVIAAAIVAIVLLATSVTVVRAQVSGPTANDDGYETTQLSGVFLDPLANDTAGDDPLDLGTFNVISGPTRGTVGSFSAVGGNYEVTDLGSTNGVKIGGTRIEGPTVLEHGTSVMFGHVQASFHTELATKPTPIPDEGNVPGGVNPATTALTPSNFANAFTKKSKPKDPGGQMILAFGCLAVAVAVLAICCALIMKA